MKIKKYSLQNLLKTIPVLSENEISNYLGGGDGSANCPYTEEEFEIMCNNGTWTGGYVGDTYRLGMVYCYGSSNYHVYSDYDQYLLDNDPEAYFSRQFNFINSWSNYTNSFAMQNPTSTYGSNMQFDNIRAATVKTSDVISSIMGGAKKNATKILDDRGKYLAHGAIYKLDREITVRLPVGNVTTTSKVLNVVRVGGHWIGIIGAGIDLADAGVDFINGNTGEGVEKIIDLAVCTGLSFIPGVGWACALGYSIFADDIHELVKGN